MSNETNAAEPSGASAGSHGPLFSERLDMARAALNWCDRHNVERLAVNIVTALFTLGLVQKPQPTLTDEERGAIEFAADIFEDFEDSDGNPLDNLAAVLDGLLERLK